MHLWHAAARRKIIICIYIRRVLLGLKLSVCLTQIRETQWLNTSFVLCFPTCKSVGKLTLWCLGVNKQITSLLSILIIEHTGCTLFIKSYLLKSWWHSLGSHRLNQLGGAYINGKPLPKEIRNEILTLALQGFRPCDISRRLRITHGCISKLLSKYRKTGSIQVGGESAGRPRVITPRIAQRIMEYRKEQPGLFSWEIRDRLVQESLCSKDNPPSLSSISRLLKNKNNLDTTPGIIRECNSNSYMIASILNLPPYDRQSSSWIPSSMESTSTDNHGQRAEHKQTGQ